MERITRRNKTDRKAEGLKTSPRTPFFVVLNYNVLFLFEKTAQHTVINTQFYSNYSLAQAWRDRQYLACNIKNRYGCS